MLTLSVRGCAMVSLERPSVHDQSCSAVFVAGLVCSSTHHPALPPTCCILLKSLVVYVACRLARISRRMSGGSCRSGASKEARVRAGSTWQQTTCTSMTASLLMRTCFRHVVGLVAGVCLMAKIAAPDTSS